MKRKVTLQQAKDLIKTQILYQLTQPQSPTEPDTTSPSVYIEGTMGIGKSMIMRQSREEISEILQQEIGLVELGMAGMSGTDIQGIPIPKKEDGQDILVWVKDAVLPGIRASDYQYGILFLDEINHVEDTSVLSLMYQLLLDKKMNDYHLPPGWVIVSAGNRAEDGGIYNRLPAPIRDRLLILEIKLSPTEWIAWAKSQQAHPAVITFINNDTDALHTYDAEKELEGDEECINYVFATPRSWIQASTEIRKFERGLLLPNGEKLYTMKTLELSLAGLLGDGLSKRFMTHYKNSGRFDVEKHLNLTWRNGQPTETVDEDLTREQLAYLATYAELRGTVQQRINVIYLLGYLHVPYQVMMLKATVPAEDLKRDIIENGNSSLIPK